MNWKLTAIIIGVGLVAITSGTGAGTIYHIAKVETDKWKEFNERQPTYSPIDRKRLDALILQALQETNR